VRVAVIGGGATGLGVAWDLALRGLEVTLFEQRELAGGTTGRFHGLLHSGGRYLVTDPSAAKECFEESQLLSHIAPEGVELTGGYFVRLAGDDPAFESAWVKRAEDLALGIRPAAHKELASVFPSLTREAASGWWVPDGVLEGFRMAEMLAAAIVSRGGIIREHAKVVGLEAPGDTVHAVTIETPGGTETVACDAVVNCAGPWAGVVAGDLGLKVRIQPSFGLMLIFANRMVPKVINRLKRPGDGDIFVPHQEVVILGTTDVAQDHPEAPLPRREDVAHLMALGRELFPELDSWRILRAFNGVRPLYLPSEAQTDSRALSRDFTVIDHGASEGLEGAFSLVGGKWTTFRLMAERLGDALCSHYHIDAPCRTRETPIAQTHRPAHASSTPILCECEHVAESDLGPEESTDKLRLGTWFGMGPCQGTFCAHRVLGRSWPGELDSRLAKLREERERGLAPVMWGANARLVALNRSLRGQLLGEDLR